MNPEEKVYPPIDPQGVLRKQVPVMTDFRILQAVFGNLAVEEIIAARNEAILQNQITGEDVVTLNSIIKGKQNVNQSPALQSVCPDVDSSQAGQEGNR
jgi:hypothetical protein